MIHSFSSLSKFLNCPRQFEAQYVTKEFKDTGSEATRKGDIIHKELELYIKGEQDRQPVVAPADGLHDVLRTLKTRGVPVEVEQSLAINRKLKPTDFWAKDAYLRGKLDVVVYLPDITAVIDHKSGKKRNNNFQASVCALLAHAHAPGKEPRIFFDYLEKGREKPITPTHNDMMEVIKTAMTVDETTVFPPKPSGLCRFCPVTTCEFNLK